MTTWRLFDGAGGRPGNGPATGTAFAGSYIAGNMFCVSQGGKWLTGYFWWVAASGQDTAPVGGFKFALWQLATSSTGVLVPGSVVSIASLTAGQWNFVPLPTPLLLAPSASNSYGSVYLAAIGYTAAAGFPSTQNVFGLGDPFANGIVNGPLIAPSSHYVGSTQDAGNAFAWTKPQCPFSTAGSDPSVIMPGSNDADDNLWIDIQISDQAPAGATFRAFPNMPQFVDPGSGAQATAFTLGLQFSVSQACQLKKIWHWSPSGATVLPTRCGLWNVGTQTEVAGSDNSSPTWSGAAGSGWISVSYASGPTLAAGTQYKVSTFTSDNVDPWFQAFPSWWGGAPGPFSSGFTQGPLTIPGNAAASPGQNSWNQGIAWTYPNTSTNPEYDAVDVELLPIAAPSTPAAVLFPQMTDSTFTPATGGWPQLGYAMAGGMRWYPA